MKKKIIALTVVIALLVVSAIGATLAYFTDTDEATNVFTAGNVDIDLEETFVQDSALVPGVDVNKDVYISNTGSNSAYVWYEYLVPAAVDNAGAIHVDMAADSADQWDTTMGCIGTETVDGVEYNVYVVLYKSALDAGAQTAQGMDKVYLDAAVDYDNENACYTMDGEAIDFDLNETKIIVRAYAIQAEGFADVNAAYAAYNA